MMLTGRFSKSMLHETLYRTIKTLVTLGILLLFLGIPSQPWNQGAMTAFAATTVAEGNDFATHVLRDPWDMSAFTDISLGFNNSGQTNYLQNYQVQNGIFSAQATSSADGQFPLLFPGYRINQTTNAINVGKYGVNYPIPSSTYHCLYYAMRVNSSSPDWSQVFWFANTHLNDGTAPWGVSNGIYISPSIWKLYQVNLASYYGTGTPWSNNATWQGLVLKATGKANATFAVDWVRLTDCAAVNTTINWSGSAGYLWLISASTGNSILAKEGLKGTSTSLDTQGVAPGTYQVCLSTSASSCNASGTPNPSSLTINQAPIVKFNRPSPTSGADYATQYGNPWDFSDATDIARTIRFENQSLGGGVLSMWTASGDPAWGADPIIWPNYPHVIATGSQYRYLSYRLYTQWPLQNVPQGMLVRWSWGIGGCEVVTRDIPFDVGWQTYSIDLSDPSNGSAVEPNGCSPSPVVWSTSTNITGLRFDPNENILGQTLYQQLDWIRLTEVDKVTHGSPFPVETSLNKPSQGTTLTYYYTTNPQQPTQHVASPYVASPPSRSSHQLYLPLTMSNYNGIPGASTPSFLWDTTSVATGTFYLCVTADDTKNRATYCSDAPVVVN